MGKHRTRLARPDEVKIVADIEASAARKFRGWPGFETVDLSFLPRPKAFEPFVRDGRAIVVVNEDDRPLGFVTVSLMDGEPYIAELDVALDHQGEGLGRILIERACDWAREQGAQSVLLRTFSDIPWNGPYYERLGFRTLKRSEIDRDGMRRQVRSEKNAGVDISRRIFMRKQLA